MKKKKRLDFIEFSMLFEKNKIKKEFCSFE